MTQVDWPNTWTGCSDLLPGWAGFWWYKVGSTWTVLSTVLTMSSSGLKFSTFTWILYRSSSYSTLNTHPRRHSKLSLYSSVADPDVYPGSRIRLFSIPDPGSRIRTVSIQDPGSASKNLSILSQKKWFLSSRKYDPGCSSQIPDPDADFLPIPDPRSQIQGSKRHRIPDPISRIRIRNTALQYCCHEGATSNWIICYNHRSSTQGWLAWINVCLLCIQRNKLHCRKYTIELPPHIPHAQASIRKYTYKAI